MSQISDEAERQLKRLAKIFTPVPLASAKDEYLAALCEAGTVAGVEEVGERLMRGFPLDWEGCKRTRFPNTSEIAAVVEEIRAGSPPAATQCPLCRGSGMLHSHVETHEGFPYEFAVRCDHAREERELGTAG